MSKRRILPSRETADYLNELYKINTVKDICKHKYPKLSETYLQNIIRIIGNWKAGDKEAEEYLFPEWVGLKENEHPNYKDFYIQPGNWMYAHSSGKWLRRDLYYHGGGNKWYLKQPGFQDVRNDDE